MNFSESGTLDSICKVAVFGLGCEEFTPSIESETFTDTDETFDLISGPDMDIALPVLTIEPSGCFPPSWKVHRTIDDADMGALFPDNFVIDSTNLNIRDAIDNFSDRHSLYSNGVPVSYYFEGTLSDDASTLTNRHYFTISFTDACQSATITTDPFDANFNVPWSSA